LAISEREKRMAEHLEPTEGAAAAQRFGADGVRFVRVNHADPHGRCRSKELPISRLGLATDGIGYCAASLVEGLDGEPLMGEAFPGGQGFPDLHAIGDLATARIAPWQPDTLWLLADLVEPDGSPSPLCMRGVLRRVIERLASRGLHAMVASEPEFYVLRVDEGAVTHYSPLAGMAYTTGVRADPTGLVRRIHHALDEFGLGVTTALREFSPGQFEINLTHADALTAADNAFLLEEVVKELAASEGLLATFMAKPLTDSEGSSHHVHASLWRGDKNAFDDGGQISAEARAFAAGLIVHAEGLTALAAPTINSYKRLGNGEMCPSVATLGGDSRQAYVRVPPERGAATRVELRVGDASANPYLLIAGTLAAGLDGIERGLDPDATPPLPLPRSLDAALTALENDTVLAGMLGPQLLEAMAAVKRREIERFNLAVTDWEWREYATHA
jgi:glutamine synthetase